MTTATSETAVTDADRYLKEIAPHLAALSAEERAELLDDLAQHLREIAAEPGPPLAERLGSPATYAAELLASAGVEPGGPPRRPLSIRATSMARRARGSAVGHEMVRLWPVLRPAWWVARAYLAVSLVAATEHTGGYRETPLPRLAGNHVLGLLAVLVAIPVSVRLGQRNLSRPGRLAVNAGNVVLVIYALSLLGRGGPGPTDAKLFSLPAAPAGRECLLNGSGQPITNLYAYDADGRLLDPVLLFDQNGQPVDNLCQGFDERGRRLSTDVRQDVNGALVPNAFPQHQSTVSPVEGGGLRPGIAGPDATVPVKPPAVVVPRLAPTTVPPPG
ncbi:MAG TPA: hypothetical protein VHT97_13705 [Acidimicrobiales bacterium]|nr:hypothetical protein [Acidimicrobiales bacterium]